MNKKKCIECNNSHFYYTEFVGMCWKLNKIIRKDDERNKCNSYKNKKGENNNVKLFRK